MRFAVIKKKYTKKGMILMQVRAIYECMEVIYKNVTGVKVRDNVLDIVYGNKDDPYKFGADLDTEVCKVEFEKDTEADENDTEGD